jgi:hypothetical protein
MVTSQLDIALRQSMKPNMRVEVAAFEPNKLACVFDIYGAPIGVSAVGDDYGAVAPIRFVRSE